jgi:hypothetical protein
VEERCAFAAFGALSTSFDNLLEELVCRCRLFSCTLGQLRLRAIVQLNGHSSVMPFLPMTTGIDKQQPSSCRQKDSRRMEQESKEMLLQAQVNAAPLRAVMNKVV